MKCIDAACGRDVELTVHDDLTQEIEFATDMATSMWCPREVHDRLDAFIRKALDLIESTGWRAS